MTTRDGSAGRGAVLGQGIFLLVLLTYLAALTVGLRGLPDDARLFPVIILCTAAVFLVLKAIAVASVRARRYLEPGVPLAVARAPLPDTGHGERARGARTAIVAWLWVGAAVASMYLIGFLAGTGLSVLAYLRLVARDSWRASLIASGATLAFAYLVFARAMHIELDLGLLGRAL